MSFINYFTFQIINTINKGGFAFLKFIIFIEIIMTGVGIFSYVTEGDNKNIKNGLILTTISIAMFIFAKKFIA
ncbi:hypothetical protein AB2T14_003526 [Clostridium botulinum]